VVYYASLPGYGRLAWYPTSNSGRGRERTLTLNTIEGESMKDISKHKHNFLATDIPGVCLCKCGVERYYSRELQDYVIVGASA
jgi:hypothetical protein